MNNCFYVYVWIREDYNTIFYVGKGKTDYHHNRAKTMKNNRHFKYIYNKVPTHYKLIHEGLTEDEAFRLEKETIHKLVYEEGYSIQARSYKGKEIKGRHLVNCTFGGEGISGYRHTPEGKAKSAKHGKDNPMYGRRGKLSPHYGVKKSEEHKEKIKLSNSRRKNVYCIELDKNFNSYREASKAILKEYNIVCSHASISAQCRGKISYTGYYADTKEPAYLHFETRNTDND